MKSIFRAHRRRNRGFTLIELLIVIAVICTIMSMAIPSLLSSRVAANETSAIASLRIIAKGMEAYRIKQTGGALSYPADYRSLADLNPPELDDTLATGEKSGYGFSGGGGGATFAVNAVPISYGTTGRRSFYVDATGVLRSKEDNGNPASATDSPIS